METMFKSLELLSQFQLFRDGGTLQKIQKTVAELGKVESSACVADLRITDPTHDKVRIEQTKGGLFNEGNWVVDHSTYKAWRDGCENNVLFVMGPADKGKTMILCGLIDDLEDSSVDDSLLVYFFCEGTNVTRNTPTMILRRLIYMLIIEAPKLLTYLQEKYRYAGKALFEDPNAWYVLSALFMEMLNAPESRRITVLVDAVDEISIHRDMFLKYLGQVSKELLGVKWIVSGRPVEDIEERSGRNPTVAELNLQSIDNAAAVEHSLDTYIGHRLEDFPKPDSDTQLRQYLGTELRAKAQGTLLWVALVMDQLRNVRKARLLDTVKQMPLGLTSLYHRMIGHIQQLPQEDRDICLKILSVINAAYRPLRITELQHLMYPHVEDEADTQECVALCGSLLVVTQSNIQLVHQSAKDFLVKVVEDETVTIDTSQAHHDIWDNSQHILAQTLRRNMYRLPSAGSLLSDFEPPPNSDPLRECRYSVVYCMIISVNGWPALARRPPPRIRRRYYALKKHDRNSLPSSGNTACIG